MHQRTPRLLIQKLKLLQELKGGRLRASSSLASLGACACCHYLGPHLRRDTLLREPSPNHICLVDKAVPGPQPPWPQLPSCPPGSLCMEGVCYCAHCYPTKLQALGGTGLRVCCGPQGLLPPQGCPTSGGALPFHKEHISKPRSLGGSFRIDTQPSHR